MIEIVAVIMAISVASFAEWRHYKAGNGKRFERVHQLLTLKQE